MSTFFYEVERFRYIVKVHTVNFAVGLNYFLSSFHFYTSCGTGGKTLPLLPYAVRTIVTIWNMPRHVSNK